MRYYSDLLPSYLDGENIRKHSSVIERSDRYLDGLVELFGLWDKMERPILIKREQLQDDGVNNVTLYVNTPTPITEIIIEGDIEETITPEDTVTTSYENTWTIEEPSIEIYTRRSSIVSMKIRMPSLRVIVRTETHTYTKTYPENDTLQNNDADHDIFLDIVGGLLGIPRRQYAAVPIPLVSINHFNYTVPPFMAKEVKPDSPNVTILPCSEDDYYYYERLEYFINTTDNLRLFRTMYDKDVSILLKEDGIIPSELGGTETTILFTHIKKGAGGINYLNIDTTNIQQIAEQSLPLTRPVQIYPYATLRKYASTTQEEYVNRYKLHLVLGLNAKTIDQQQTSDELPIANLPVNITYEDGTEVGTFTTDENGTAHISIDGARGGQQTLKWNLTREYPYFSVITGGSRLIQYNASLFKLSLDDDAWQYKVAAGTGVTDFEPPTILTNNDLDCGRGYMVYTPAINPSLVDLTDYTLHVVFHYTTSAQQIRFGTLSVNSQGVANITGVNVTPRSYESSNQQIKATHTLDFKFTDGVCSVYYDDVDTGVSKDFNGTEAMIYIAGYNSRESGSTQGLHIEEITTEEEIWITNKTADKNNQTFTESYPFSVSGKGLSPAVQEDGSLRVRSNYVTDWMYYQAGEDWKISLEIKINNLNSSEMGVITDSVSNGGIWNIHGKWLDYDDSTDTGNVRTQLNNLSYGNGDTLSVIIEKHRDTITWKFTDSNDNKQTIVCTNYEQNIDTRFYMRCSKDDTNIVMNKYERTTRTIADTRQTTAITSETINTLPGTASVQATLTTGGTGISGATILCKNGTTLITSGTTDTNGECTLDLSTLTSGSYTLTIEYDGDRTYSATSTTHSITITDQTGLNLYGKGQTTGWSTARWTTIEINAAGEAHCNYTKRNAILKNLPLSGDFTLILHIQASHNTSWNWGLIPSQRDYSNPAMKVSKGDTLNTNTSIATMFDHESGVWDTTVPVTVTRSGTTYTLEYNGNSYSFTGSTDTLYLWMDKTGSGNLFLTYIETTATMQ